MNLSKSPSPTVEKRSQASDSNSDNTTHTLSTSKKRASGMKNMAMASSLARRAVAAKKEEQIASNIQQVFKDRELKMTERIITTMWEDKLRVYKAFRKAVEADIKDLEKDRQKLLRRKKNKKEKTRMLLKNSVERLTIMCQCLK